MKWNSDDVRGATASLICQDKQSNKSLVADDVALVPVSAILPRLGPATRGLDLFHVVHLAQCIAVISLLEPIVVDQRNRLIAGAHRLAACQLLTISANESPSALVSSWHLVKESWNHVSDNIQFDIEQKRTIWRQTNPLGLVPIRRLSFDAEKEPSTALRAEIAENEVRRPYTPHEIRAMAERLKAAGYRRETGRPKNGEVALTPPLATFTGKCHRTIQRILNGTPHGGKHVPQAFTSKRAIARCNTAIRMMEAALAKAPDEEPWITLKKTASFLRIAIKK